MSYKVWDKRNRLVESRTASNALLGQYFYNERGLRVKAVRAPQPEVRVVAPNGGESLFLGATNMISWSGAGLEGALVSLDLLAEGAVAGTIAENLPGTQTSYAWQAGETLAGTVAPGAHYRVRVTAVVPAGGPETAYYFYDSGGRLLAEYDGAGACVKDYLYLGGKMIGEYQPATGAYYYYASDQINSTRLVTDATGAVVRSAQYDPYGGLYKTWVDTYHPKPGFSGKEREAGSGLDYFGARYYGHGQYRFLSVDPVINKDETISNPQLWNLYAYCRNNPLTFFDPSGSKDKLIARMEDKIRRVERGFAQYHNNVENDNKINNIDYSKVNAWGIKKGITLGLDVAAVEITAAGFFVTGPIGFAATFLGSLACDTTSGVINKNIPVSISPEIGSILSGIFSEVTNYAAKSLKLPFKVDSKAVMGMVGIVLGSSNIKDNSEELRK